MLVSLKGPTFHCTSKAAAHAIPLRRFVQYFVVLSDLQPSCSEFNVLNENATGNRTLQWVTDVVYQEIVSVAPTSSRS